MERPEGVSRILVIDDEHEMLMNYRRLIGRVGHECITSNDPGQIGDLLARHRPDLVITDLMMPGGSGMTCWSACTSSTTDSGDPDHGARLDQQRRARR